jgi:hypothetical protein
VSLRKVFGESIHKFINYVTFGTLMRGKRKVQFLNLSAQLFFSEENKNGLGLQFTKKNSIKWPSSS